MLLKGYVSAYNLLCASLYIGNRHCADVISLANQATVVRVVTPALLDLLMYWVQSGSGYHILFAKTIPTEWAMSHQPVLSQRGNVVAWFTTYTSGRTGGKGPWNQWKHLGNIEGTGSICLRCFHQTQFDYI